MASELKSPNLLCRYFGCQTYVPMRGCYTGMPQTHCYDCGLRTWHARKDAAEWTPPFDPRLIDVAATWLSDMLCVHILRLTPPCSSGRVLGSLKQKE